MAYDEVMSAEQYAATMDETDPAHCECRHEGLPVAWHLSFCLVVRR